MNAIPLIGLLFVHAAGAAIAVAMRNRNYLLVCAAVCVISSLLLLPVMPVPATVALIAWFVLIRYEIQAYNRLVSLGQNCDRLLHGVSVAELRRQGTIPRLEAFTAKYSSHERQTLLSTVQARGGRAANLAVLFEQYPVLKADQTFLRLFQELVRAEDEIRTARLTYNSAAANFNAEITRFPMILAARAMALGPRPFLHA